MCTDLVGFATRHGRKKTPYGEKSKVNTVPAVLGKIYKGL